MAEFDIGLYGLAVMGQNLALNLADNGFRVIVHNRTKSKITNFMEGVAADKPIAGAEELEDFVTGIKKPRVVLLIVKAGPAVDAVIEQLKPYLEEGDIIIDGGNSHYKDTDRRVAALAEEGIQFIGMGISGGEEGARHGPSMMPGGSPEAYERIQPMVEAVAAEADGEPCVTYLGPRSAGHYVKMVHNGIEYAIMQAIVEAYDLLLCVADMEPAAISKVFRRWNEGKLSSFLVDITGQILSTIDPKTGEPLINQILDQAKQKGTGKWTTQDALDMGVAVPTISAAVEARIISGLKQEREEAEPILEGALPQFAGTVNQLIDMVANALLATMVCAYAQGFAALRAASAEYDYDLKLADVARIWRGGCIIRAELLDDIAAAFDEKPDLPNLLIAPYFINLLADTHEHRRLVVRLAIESGIPVPAMSSALAYYDSYRTARLPANLIQAQRDYFGAHTYERIDEEGTFHTEWQDHDKTSS